MTVKLIIGPAGSGKSFHCLHQIRPELEASPEGGPLLMLALKQSTFQLEVSESQTEFEKRIVMKLQDLGLLLNIINGSKSTSFKIQTACWNWPAVN